ncbi:MAG: O-antigen ligase family protein [Actinobacteria bacterium]|nr:O-antigen ligase family protein [Actinomycetota bacterium]
MSAFLSGAGVLIAAGAAAASILLPAGRLRSALMLVALVLFPILILGDQWHSHRIVELRHHGAKAGVAVVVGVILVVALAYVFRRWPVALPLAVIGLLPFRIPLESGGESANLLVPLYVVIAAGVLAAVVSPDPPPGERRLAWLPKALAAFVFLYALQALYSDEFSKALQEICFFMIPFTLVYGLLREVEWDRRLLVWALGLIAAEATAFVVVGSVEYLSRSLFWNEAVIRSNEFHTYFRVNSMFWDPNIYGRYLSLVLVVVTAVMLWIRRPSGNPRARLAAPDTLRGASSSVAQMAVPFGRPASYPRSVRPSPAAHADSRTDAKERRAFWTLTAAMLVLWLGLAQTFSQSSFVALLAGLAMLAALRWSWRWTLAVTIVGVIGGALVVLLVGGKSITPDRLNVDFSGRGHLISGGAELFSERPLWGYGSGSFQHAYSDHHKGEPVTISHTEPVTVAAEQGLIGLVVYVTLVLVALWTMGAGLWARGPDRGPPHVFIARTAVLAAFVALLVHTMAYAGFFQDPITWVLMAIGASLAASRVVACRDT